MNRVLLAGYYGMQNTGDDALLAVTSWAAARFFAGHAIRALSASVPAFPGSDEVFPIYSTPQRFRGEYRLRTLVEGRGASQVIFGGGSVFHSASGIRRARWLTRLAGKGPHIAAGVSLGPFRNTAAERACARLLRELHFVGLRDQPSADIARSLAPAARVETTFDLGVLLPLVDSTGPSQRLPQSVGFALCDFERFTGGDPVRDTRRRQLLLQLVAALDPSIVRRAFFIDFNGNPKFGDRSIHLEVAAAVPRPIAVTHVPYATDPGKLLRLIGSLEVVVSMRLHAAVFAYVTQTPNIMLSYHPKCTNWSSSIGMPKSLIHDSCEFSPTGVAALVHSALSGPAPKLLDRAKAQALALRNFPADLVSRTSSSSSRLFALNP